MIVTPVAQHSLPNLDDYELLRQRFSWEAAERALPGLPGARGLNIAREAVDRHVAEGRGERVALRWIAKGQRSTDV
jgi:acetyl-CoA synthetase